MVAARSDGVRVLWCESLAWSHGVCWEPSPRVCPLSLQENRYRLLGEVVEAVKAVYPPERIAVRLSPNGVYGGMGSESNHVDFPYFASRLAEVRCSLCCACC